MDISQLVHLTDALPFAQAAGATPADNAVFRQITDFILRFTALFYEALPWVILGSVLAAIVQELPTRRSPAIMVPVGIALLILTISPLPWMLTAALAVGVAALSFLLMLRAQPLVDRFLPFLGRHRTLAIAMSGLLGFIIPMCECGIIAVMRRLYRKGMPLSCCTAYILAGPIINVVVLCTTYVAFAQQVGRTVVGGQPVYHMSGWLLMVLRGVMGYVTAVVAGLLVERQFRKHGSKLVTDEIRASGLPLVEDAEENAPPVPFARRIGNIAGSALHDILDITFYLIIGALLAAGVGTFLIDKNQVVGLSHNQPLLAIALLMGLGFLITLCSEADAFVAASFSTLSSAPKLAFMVFGPMLDLKLFLMYTRVFRPRLMALIILAITVQVFVYSYLTHLGWQAVAPHLVPPLPTPGK